MNAMSQQDFLRWFRRLKRQPSCLMALTGAGVSAESGVPTFRGSEDDVLWQHMDPASLFTPESLLQDPLTSWQFYDGLRVRVAGTRPNDGHHALATLARQSRLTLATQNIDGLHQRAGSEDVLELHGTLWRLRCDGCAYSEPNTLAPLPSLPPRCPTCDDILRPDIVLFTEALPAETLSRAMLAAEQCDLMLVIGTSGVVYPAAGLPNLARANGALVVEINPQETSLTRTMDCSIRASAAEALPWVVAELMA